MATHSMQVSTSNISPYTIFYNWDQMCIYTVSVPAGLKTIYFQSGVNDFSEFVNVSVEVGSAYQPYETLKSIKWPNFLSFIILRKVSYICDAYPSVMRANLIRAESRSWGVFFFIDNFVKVMNRTR